MGLFTLEHSKLAYRTDFALYGVAVASLLEVIKDRSWNNFISSI